MQKKSKIGKFIYFCAIVALAIAFSIFTLEKSQVTNLYTKPASTEVTDIRPTNDVQYTPANPKDNEETNKQKEDGTLGQSTEKPAAGSPISVVLTAAAQDEVGGPVVVRVLLSDVTNGKCDVVMKKDGSEKSYTASVINAGTYYTCDGFEIPLDDLATGTWSLTVTVSNDERSGTAQQTVEVKL